MFFFQSQVSTVGESVVRVLSAGFGVSTVGESVVRVLSAGFGEETVDLLGRCFSVLSSSEAL